MKSTLLAQLCVVLFFFTSTAQEISPIRMGQFFEQGYGRAPENWANEESALDVKPTANGLVMSGWVDTEEAGGKNMALWQIDENGQLTQFGEYGFSGVDQISAAVALHSQSGFVLAGRQSSYYEDSYHSTINLGDEALIKFIQSNGTEVWSMLVDSTGGPVDTNQVAVDVINDGSDNFLVLINRIYGENQNQDFRVIKLTGGGNVIWDKRHTLLNQNVFAQKIIGRGNGHFLVLANNVNGSYPILYEIDGINGDYETHEEYPQPNPVTCFGITNNVYNQYNSGYRIAGYQDNGVNEDGFILEVDNTLLEGSTNIIENPTTGNESFRDIEVHPTGFVAIGECNNRGEGKKDVWICHLDTLADTLKIETLGGEETDYGHSATLIPNAFSVFIAGYNNSYTIEESGNAYLGGVKVDMGLPENTECKVSRSLWVDKFTWNNGNGGIDLSNYILGNSSDEDDLVDFAENHNITYLILYGLNFIFEPNYQLDPSTKQAKVALSNFINKCYQASPRITVGLVSTTKEVVWTNGIQYNIDVANNSSKYNYNRNGKISYFVLEHEFWRAHGVNAFSGNTAFYIDVNGKPQNHQEDGASSTANDVPTSLLNDHFSNVWNDHKTILTNLKNNKAFDANVVGLHDYISFLYYTYSGASSANDNSSKGHQISRAQFIENKADAIFFTYYRKYFSSNNGQNFLNSYPYALDRLSFFGSQSQKTHIIPLFSGEIWDPADASKQCGDDASTDFLGKFLEDLPGSGTGTFKDVETTYQSQHQTVYNNTTTYPDIQNIKVANYSWFKYSCVEKKLFVDNGLVDCESFNEVLSVDKEQIINSLIVYPNPNNGKFRIESADSEKISELQIFNQVGQLVQKLEASEEYQVNLNTGIYILIVVSEKGDISSHKVSIQ